MKQVSPNIYVGNLKHYKILEKTGQIGEDSDWGVISACKHPSYVEARDNPDSHIYSSKLMIVVPNRLIFNIVDSEKPDFFTLELFRESFKFIEAKLEEGKHIFIHCNQGVSRSPSIAMAYLAWKGEISSGGVVGATTEFREKYEAFHPRGIGWFMLHNWKDLMNISI